MLTGPKEEEEESNLREVISLTQHYVLGIESATCLRAVNMLSLNLRTFIYCCI
jgi:hypothetical protein